jgi:hypothetical protein
MIGSRNTLFHGSTPESPRLLSTSAMDELRRNRPKRWLPRVQGGPIAEWLRAIKGQGPKPGSNFDYAADLTQMALLGNVAMRSGKDFAWDDRAGRILGDSEPNQSISIKARAGWKVQ